MQAADSKTPARLVWSVAAGLLALALLLAFLAANNRGPAPAPLIAPPATAPVPDTLTDQTRRNIENFLNSESPGNGSVVATRDALMELPPGKALQLIQELLRSGQDRSTGMEFEIADGGNLKQWPTFRTLLLDLAGNIDPAAAADLSREVLARPTSADEWALALRNLGRVGRGSETDDFLLTKTVELINHPEWQAEPSVGYLNAFDVLVHLEATSQTPLLSGFVQRKDRQDLAHAAFLTIDRLVQRRPEEMLRQIAADDALSQSRPEMAAQQLARADLREDTQRAIVQNWLLDSSRTPAELNAFAGIYPNHNQFISHNLLTREAPVSGTDLAAHDRAALDIIASWRADPVFETVTEHLNTITGRLQQFTGGSPP